MKTSKRKRSSKSEPVAPATAGGAEPVVALDPVPAESVVTESVPAANEAVVAEVAVADSASTVAAESASEAVAAEVVAEPPAAEAVSAEAVVAESEPMVAVATDSTSEPVAADAPSATQADPVVVLAANCSVKDAAALKSSLCAVANEKAAVTLDASAVERVDTATMQLLCAFVRDRSSRSQNTVWRGRSQALHDAVRLLGVAALIGFDAAIGVAA